MGLAIEKLSVPLREDAEGVVRVGGTRVTLHTLVGAFRNGATPEAIVQDYSSLALGDVYTTIAFFLQNRAEVEAYLQEQERKGAEVQRQVEARCDPTEFRQRLLARRKETA